MQMVFLVMNSQKMKKNMWTPTESIIRFRGFCSVCHNPVYFEISNWTTTDGCPAHKKCLDNYLIDTENGPFVAICRRKDCNYVFYGEDHELIKLHADDHYLKRHNLPYGPYQEYPIGHETFLLLDKPGGKSGRKARHQLIENIKEIYGQEIGTS
jgi:hypothetical protein